MGNQLVWNERYNLGVSIIDKEHKRLFKILNKLFDFGRQEDKSQWICQETLKYFKSHALLHFADEEKYMESVKYEGADMHKRIHKDFREAILPALEVELETSGYSENAVEHFLGVCAGWLIGHTLIEDRAIVDFELIKKWENILPEEEQSLMEEAVINQLQLMFQLDPHIISSCYGGEKFGDGIYYRLVYKTGENKRTEFLLIFEEKLIVNTVGNVLNAESEKLDVMIMNAARYTARQFVRHFIGHFPELEQAEIEKEQLLTYEQFQKVFGKQGQHLSLLFDTGKGYFGFCMNGADTALGGGGVSIKSDNAMFEIERYLYQNEKEKDELSHKKKILVVDDSEFMLTTMQHLLSEEYELMTAMSGLSAFRSITLDRPDLIILDYEMPVCDGKQVLEMIRSEKIFMDIPVIFLTSNVSRENVKKVAELKPQGYLLKSLPLETIKNEIDNFFEKKG